MEEIEIKAYAKVNLALDVLGRRPDNFYDLSMFMQMIDLCDIVRVRWEPELPGGINLTVTRNSELPSDERNLGWRAAEFMSWAYHKKGRISISVEKNIPMTAGLAGGSSDAAAVVLALARLWDLHVPMLELVPLCTNLGADVPFCAMGNAALNPVAGYEKDSLASAAARAEGIGEKLTAIKPLEGWLILVKPQFAVSTAEIFRKINLENLMYVPRPNVTELIDAISCGDMNRAEPNMINLLEEVSGTEYPEIKETVKTMMEITGGAKTLMSGSGPTVFTYFKDRAAGERFLPEVQRRFPQVYFVKLRS